MTNRTKTAEGIVCRCSSRIAKSGSTAYEFFIDKERFSYFVSKDNQDKSFLLRDGDCVRFDFQTRRLRTGTRSTYNVIDPGTVEFLYFHGSAANGYVYVLSNVSMPGLLKIGYTETTPLKRAADLSTATGVPTPFKVEWSLSIDGDAELVEKRTHAALDRHRSGKEFFKVSIETARLAIHQAYAELYPEAAGIDHTAILGERAVEQEKERKEAIARVMDERARKAFESTPEGRWRLNGSCHVILQAYSRLPDKTARSLFARLISGPGEDWLEIEVIGRGLCHEKPWRVIARGRQNGRELEYCTGRVDIGDCETLPQALDFVQNLLSKHRNINHQISVDVSNRLCFDPSPGDASIVTGRESVRVDGLFSMHFRNQADQVELHNSDLLWRYE